MFDIIIATLNRADSVKRLCESILDIKSKLLKKIIVVDSSENDRFIKINNDKVSHFRTNHKNQPYQRFLGWNLSKAKYLIFLDDDIDILNKSFFDNCFLAFKEKNVVGINLKLDQKAPGLEKINSNSFNFSVPSYLKTIIGSPKVGSNKFSYCGKKGKRVSGRGIEYVHGGAFAIRKRNAYNNFNKQLFDIYSAGLGKGEDAIFGYNLSKTGKIIALETCYFLHNGNDKSNYDYDLFNFGQRIMFSKLYSSCEFYRLNEKNSLFGYFRYFHYSSFQIIGSYVKSLMRPNVVNKTILKGNLAGFKKSFSFSYISNLERNVFWDQQVKIDKINNS
jgi:hypothetical protein